MISGAVWVTALQDAPQGDQPNYHQVKVESPQRQGAPPYRRCSLARCAKLRGGAHVRSRVVRPGRKEANSNEEECSSPKGSSRTVLVRSLIP